MIKRISAGFIGLSGLFLLTGCNTPTRGTGAPDAKDAYEMVDNWGAAKKRQGELEQKKKNAEIMREFMAPLERYRNAPITEKARRVHEAAQRAVTYMEDSAQYGKIEYWAAPAETLRSKKGDCEDFAILKYHALRALGLEDSDMCLAGTDTDGDMTVDHCILIVFDEGKWLVLDNRREFGTYKQENDCAYILFNEAGVQKITVENGVATISNYERPKEGAEPAIRAMTIRAPGNPAPH